MALNDNTIYDELIEAAQAASAAFDEEMEDEDDGDDDELEASGDDEDDDYDDDDDDEGDDLETVSWDEDDEDDDGDDTETLEASGEDEDDDDDDEEDDDDEDDGLEAGMAFALGADDKEEFFERVGGALRRAGRVGAGIGRGRGRRSRARTRLRTVLRLIARVRQDGGSEDGALDAIGEFAATRRGLSPIVAGLAARALIRRSGRLLRRRARRQVVRKMRAAALLLQRRQGPKGIRALIRVVRGVRRNAASRRASPLVRARLVLNSARRVAANPGLARRLARPIPRGRALLRRRAAVGRAAGVRSGRRVGRPVGRRTGVIRSRGRKIALRGPVRITIGR